MDRRKFLHHSCLCGVTAVAAGSVLKSCTPAKYSTGTIIGSDLIVPIEDFVEKTDNGIRYRNYVIASNEILRYPLCIYRLSDSEYQALWTECTHQGYEVQVFGDRLECPGHGSEFDVRGRVIEGPAGEPLRSFPVTIDGEYIKISLKK